MRITKNKPIPPKRTSGIADAMRKLEIGDSFYIAGFHNNGKFHSTARRLGIGVTVRNEAPNGGMGGFRVWRIK